MAAVNDSSRSVLAAQPTSAHDFGRVLMAVALVVVLIAAVAGIVIATSMGHGAAVVGISLIAGGLLCAAALC